MDPRPNEKEILKLIQQIMNEEIEDNRSPEEIQEGIRVMEALELVGDRFVICLN